ncbi:MAG TPA: FAD-dependent monooxygenase [Burkholderiales bacterium]|nr:FAD-dependent monooxygenase [Burkholderiales bacterium]
MTAAGGRSAIVVGGSLAGLLAAAVLSREGWTVRIFERVPEDLAGRGTGIATHQELFDAFARAGVRVDDEIGFPLAGRVGFDREGRELCRYAYRQYLSSWGTLYRRLRAAVPAGAYEPGREVADVVDGPRQALVSFRDGRQLAADLVVGADGIWSTVRAKLNPGAVPAYAGYVAWRGLIDETALPEAIRNRHGSMQGFFAKRDEQFTMYPVSGADDSLAPGRRRFGFLWYRAVDEHRDLPELLTDVDGARNRYSIAPTRIQARHIDRLRSAAGDVLPPDYAEIVCRTPSPFLQAIYDLVSDRIAFQRVALVGDAAFVARPHVGAGVLKAALDVIALADALGESDSIPRTLDAYEKVRIPPGTAMVERSRYLGAYLEGTKRASSPVPVLPMEEIIRESSRGLGLEPLARKL